MRKGTWTVEQEMKYIYQVYQDGSFSKAADNLYITQPALSISIHKVERALGMEIFDRSTRPISLTPAGELYIETIRRTMLLEEDLSRRLEDIRNLESGSLCIGGTHYLNCYILPDVLTGFTQRYPNIRIDLVEQSSARLVEMLAGRELDLTLNCNPSFQVGFHRYPAFDDYILLAVPKSFPVGARLEERALTAEEILGRRHLKADCPSVDLMEFEEMEFLLLQPGNNLRDRVIHMFQVEGFSPKVKLEVAQLVTAYHLAEHSFAAAFISDRLVTTDSRNLRYYKLRSRLAERLFYILLPQRDYTSFAVRAFIQHFRETISSHEALLQGE